MNTLAISPTTFARFITVKAKPPAPSKKAENMRRYRRVNQKHYRALQRKHSQAWRDRQKGIA